MCMNSPTWVIATELLCCPQNKREKMAEVVVCTFLGGSSAFGVSGRRSVVLCPHAVWLTVRRCSWWQRFPEGVAGLSKTDTLHPPKRTFMYFPGAQKSNANVSHDTPINQQSLFFSPDSSDFQHESRSAVMFGRMFFLGSAHVELWSRKFVLFMVSDSLAHIKRLLKWETLWLKWCQIMRSQFITCSDGAANTNTLKPKSTPET